MNSSDLKIIVSNGFNRFHLSRTAAEIHKRGLLARFITGAYPTPAVKRLAAGTRATSLIACLISAAVAASASLAIVFFFGVPYRGAIPSALVLAPAAGVLGINFTLQEGLRGLGRPYLVLRAEIIGLAVTAIALAAMLPTLGIFGAALASMAGYVAVMAALLSGARTATGASPALLLVPRVEEIRSGFRRLGALARSLAPSAG